MGSELRVLIIKEKPMSRILRSKMEIVGGILALRGELSNRFAETGLPPSVAEILQRLLASLNELQAAEAARRDREIAWKTEHLALLRQQGDANDRLTRDRTRLVEDCERLRDNYCRLLAAVREGHTN